MLQVMPGVRARRALLGPGLDPVDDVWLTFRDGRISAIGTGQPPVSLPEAPGPVLIPGLVDCHVHLAMSGGPDIVRDLAALDVAGLQRAVRANASAQVLSGVTTVRDLGSPGDLVVRMAGSLGEACRLSPTVVAAGAVTCPGGHGHFLARQAQGPRAYADAMTAVAVSGAKAVKLFATGGVITAGTVPGAPQMTPEELAAAVGAAHGLGLRVAAHAHGSTGIRNAVAAGVDSVEHFSYLDDDLVAAVRDSQAWLVSTLVATERFVAAEDRETATPETLRKILEHAPHERASLVRAVKEGCRLAVGTDAGTTFNPHGGGMQEQARHLLAAGMAPRDVLRTLTIHGAALLGEPAGVLEVGRRADLLCLAADPTEDVTALAGLRGVIRRARLVEAPQRPQQ